MLKVQRLEKPSKILLKNIYKGSETIFKKKEKASHGSTCL
jgi:hypothetical protein